LKFAGNTPQRKSSEIIAQWISARANRIATRKRKPAENR